MIKKVLTWGELNKSPQRILTFISKIDLCELFHFRGGFTASIPVFVPENEMDYNIPPQYWKSVGGVITFVYNEALRGSLVACNRDDYYQAWKSGVVIRLSTGEFRVHLSGSDLLKTSEFGGRDSRVLYQSEIEQIDGIHVQIVEKCGGSVPLWLRSSISGYEYYLGRVTGAIRIGSAGRGDFYFSLEGGRVSPSISLKCAGAPDRMNQWCGFRVLRDFYPQFYEDFFYKVFSEFGGSSPLKSVYRELPQERSLLAECIFGTAVAVCIDSGVPQIVFDGERYFLKCAHVLLRSVYDLPEGDWAPILLARSYRHRNVRLCEERGSPLIRGARIGIYPRGYRAQIEKI